MLIKSICALYQRDLHVDSLHARFDPPSVVYGACVIRVVRLREMHTKRYIMKEQASPEFGVQEVPSSNLGGPTKTPQTLTDRGSSTGSTPLMGADPTVN